MLWATDKLPGCKRVVFDSIFRVFCLEAISSKFLYVLDHFGVQLDSAHGIYQHRSHNLIDQS